MSGMADWQAKISIDIDDLKKRIKVAEGELDKVTKKDKKIKLDINTKTLESAIQKLDKMLDSLGKGTGDFKQFENLSKELLAITSEVQSFSKAFGKVDDSGTKTLLSSIQNIDRSLSDLSQHILNVNKNMGNIGGNTNGAVKQVENIGNTAAEAAKQVDKLADAQSKLGNKTNISLGDNAKKDAFQSVDNSTSVQKTTEAIKEQNSVLDENVSKIKESTNELTKGRDIISQQWYKEKGTVIGKDSKGNNITRDADQFSFVERLRNGQIQTVVATLDEKTGKWVEQIINARTAFEQVEKAIISADNKINSLKNNRDKTLAAHPDYDTSADNALIEAEKNRRAELQKTLDTYATEKEYVYQIEAANKRIAENQQRLASVSTKKENLRNTISDEKEQLEIDKQLAKEEENVAKARQKKWQAAQKEQANYENEQKKSEFIKKQTSAYDELTNTISKYSEVTKRVASGKAEDGDLELMTKLEDKISQLQKQPILSDSQVAKSEKMLVNLYDQLDKIEKKTAEANRANQANAVQNKWDKNVEAIQKYMDAVSELNRRKTVDKGTGKDSEYISAQEKEVERLKVIAKEARITLSSMVNPHNVDISTWNKWVAVMEQFSNASQGSADSVARLKDALRNVRESTLNSVQSNIDSYQKVFDKYSNANSPTTKSIEYSDNLSTLQNAISKLEEYKGKLTGVSEITETQRNQIKQYESECEKAANALKSMSAAERGVKDISLEKFLQRANKDLQENTRYSAEAKAAINALIKQAQSGDPSINIEKMTTELIKLENQEIAAGRAGKSFWDIFKTKSTYGFIGQMQSYLSMYIGFYGMINALKSGVQTLKDFDDGLTKISYTMDLTKSQLDDMGKTVVDLSKDLDSSLDDAMSVAQIYANMNTSTEEIKKLAQPTLALANLSGFDASTVADDIQAVTQQFDIAAEESDHIADVYDKISQNISVDYSKGIESIAQAVQVAGSTANQAGLSFEQLAAIVGKTVEKTRLEGSQVGNGIKTIMTRLSKVGELTDEVDNETLSKASESLHKVGVEVYNADGSFRQFDVIMGELSKKWDGLTDAERANISYNVAATRQTNLLSAILSNFSDSMDLATEATNTNGNAMENNEKWVNSFSGRLQALENTADEVWLNILDSDTLKTGISLLNNLLGIFGKLVDTIEIIPTLAGALSLKNFGKCYVSA